MTILYRVKETILSYNMLSEGDSVIIALSGGPDSVVLLHLLKRLKFQYKLRLFIGHLNHGLRGKEAFRDQKFCEELGKKLEIPVYAARINIKNLKKKEAGKSIENLARRERYKFLEKLAKKVNASKIVLGHTADDQVETVIMRFIRGAGTKGLSGIPPKRKLISGIWIVRPLINVFREGILEYLEKRKISYMKDSTNKELIFFRNKIRHELLPLLSKYNPNIKNVIQSTGTNMALINNYLEEVAEKEFKTIVDITKDGVEISSNRLKNYHPAVSQILMCGIVKEIDPSVQLESEIVKKVLALVGDTSGSKIINLPKGIKVSREYRHFVSLVTNGKKISDYSFAKRLKEINVKSLIVSISFDGGINNDNVYQIINNESCAAWKMKALDNLYTVGFNRVAVCAIIIRDLNEFVIGDLLELHNKYPRMIRHIHLRTMAKVGNYTETNPYTIEELKELLKPYFPHIETPYKPFSVCNDSCGGCDRFWINKDLEISLIGFATEKSVNCKIRGKLLDDFTVTPWFKDMKNGS